MTKSSLLQNREFFVATDSVAEVNYMANLFKNDAEHMPMFVPENSLVISPLNARSTIQGLISGARQSITLMSESLSDTQTVDLLVAAKLRRLAIRVCLPDDRPL
jgi:phosphatidylserine/phosphatidylglycerophosphate/cardiolipin synthase-like enzyme